MTDLSDGECLVRLTGRADTPPAGCCGHSRSALRFAPSSTMHHLRFWALYSRRVRERTRLSPLYRVSSLAPHPDPDVPQARCSLRVPQRLMVRPAFTLTPLILGIHYIPSAPRCSRYAWGYRCCEPWTHSSLCRHSALPCLRFTAHRHRQSKKSSLEASSRQDLFAKNRGRPKCNAETDTACRFVITHWRFYRTFAAYYFAYSANLRVSFRFLLRRAVGGSSQTEQGKNFPLNPLNSCFTAI